VADGSDRWSYTKNIVLGATREAFGTTKAVVFSPQDGAMTFILISITLVGLQLKTQAYTSSTQESDFF